LKQTEGTIVEPKRQLAERDKEVNATKEAMASLR